jgi:small-conductance mechanosensitive channel/CRP-like cAMP-binding protein
MSVLWVIYSGLFLLVTFISAVVVKRTLNASYDRKSLMAPLMFAVVAALCYFFGDLNNDFRSAESTPHQVGWTLVLLFGINAVLQFVFWLLWVFARKFNILRLPRFVFNLLISILFIGGVLFVLRNVFGYPLSGLLVTSTVVSAVIGLALQDTLSNLFSGISLQLESPFNVEDWVNLGGFEGRVVSQNWRTLTILTREHHRVSLTNKFVAEDKIVNYSRPTRKQIHNFDIVLDYQHPPNLVKKVLFDMLVEVEEVVPHSTLGAFVIDYMDSGVKYGMKYWMKDYAHVNEIQDIVLTRLWYALSRHNIKAPHPISEVQMQLINDGVSENSSKNNKTKVTFFLRKLEWMNGLNDEQVETMSDNIALQFYGQNDVIIKQGEVGDSMFIIYDGVAKVFLATAGKKVVEVAEKKPGEFMGEMSLLTGETRSASVHAAIDMTVLMINKDAFINVLMKDDHILNDMIQGMNNYKSGLAKIIEEERKRNDISTESAIEIVLQKIREYLAL